MRIVDIIQEESNKKALTKNKIIGKTNWTSLVSNEPFRKNLFKIAKDYKIDLAELKKIIQGESSFNTKAVSPEGAVGLFQFRPVVAKELGTDKDKVLKMDAAEQLKYYHLYLKKWLSKNSNAKGKLGILQAAPAFANKSDDTVVYADGTAEHKANPGWQPADGGDITIGSIKDYYKK